MFDYKTLYKNLYHEIKTVYSKVLDWRNNDYAIVGTGMILGIIIGLFVVLFHKVMELSDYAVKLFTISTGHYVGWEIIIIPSIAFLGGLLVGVLKKTVFKDATLEGMATVVKAMVFNQGKMNWKNSFKSIICAALSISSGGAAGREGPTIVLGASIGSWISQILRLKTKNIRDLAGAGTAAAVSAIFNAPLGGILFAMEGIIGDISIRSFVSLAVASVMATATTRVFVGNDSLLITPQIQQLMLGDYALLSIAGMLSGVVAVFYLNTFNFFAKHTKNILKRFPFVLRPAIGGLVVGCMVLFLPTLLETTYSPINNAIAGDGYSLIRNASFGLLLDYGLPIKAVWVFLLVAAATVVLKPISNSITLSSGGSGGTFAPAIKAGAMFGFCFGVILKMIIPDIEPGLYAIVCAGAVLAGTYQTPLAGGIILFEISKNYDLILPLVLSSVLASFIVQKSGVRTFSALQKELVDDEERMHPKLKTIQANQAQVSESGKEK